MPAREKLKAALMSEPLLTHPDYAKDFFLDCDGSGDGLGAVLLQNADDGEHVIAYASRTLLEHEKKWTATQLEAAAIIWALETFRVYIDGVHVTIRTDHAPLEYLKAKTNKCRRLERWALRLQEFRFTIAPRPAAQQKHVDALSRAPVPAVADQRPIELDVFPERVVLCVRWWKVAEVVARCVENTQAHRFPATEMRQRAVYALQPRRKPTKWTSRIPQLDGGPAGPPGEAATDEDDTCEVFLSDDEDIQQGGFSTEADTGNKGAVGVRHTAAITEVQGMDLPVLEGLQLRNDSGDVPRPPGRPIALPPAFHNLDLRRAQTEDPECRLFRTLMDKPAAAWPAPWTRANLRFCEYHSILCVVLPATAGKLCEVEDTLATAQPDQRPGPTKPRVGT